MNWKAIGHAIGKGIGWVIRHPEAVKGIKDALKDKPKS